MVELSSIGTLDGGIGWARKTASRFGWRLEKYSAWIRDKGRQIRQLPGNEAVLRAMLSPEESPVEGARYHVGQSINIYQPDGTRRRFRVFGVRNGGFSNVYTVIDLDDMRPYCLKERRAVPGDELKKEKEFAVEAEISLRLSPAPNLVTSYAAVLYRSRLMILTEHIPGSSLDEQLKRGPLPYPAALRYGLQLSSAMRHARELLPGFVHGDIKPGNCLITEDDQLKLGDFGLASAENIGKPPRRTALEEQLAVEGTGDGFGWGGTTGYMAPELFDNGSPDRTAADVYAFGVTLFEMLAGQRPFVGSSKREIISMHRTAEPPLGLLGSIGVPVRLIDLVAKCLSKAPGDRPSDFYSIRSELGDILQLECGYCILPDRIREFTPSELASKAFSLASLGKVSEAISCLNCRQDSSSPDGLAAAAVALTVGSRVEEAYEASTSALMADARPFAVLLAHGGTLIERGELENAAGYLHRARRLEPDNCLCLNLIGEVNLRLGRYRDAAENFERSRILDPSQVDVWVGLGKVSLNAARVDKAMNHFRRALSIDPRASGALTGLGDAYRSRGDLVDAVASYRSSLLLAPDRRTARMLVRSCMDLYSNRGHFADRRLARLLFRGARICGRKGGTEGPELIEDFIRLLEKENWNPLLWLLLDGTFTQLADRVDREVALRLAEALRTTYERSCLKEVEVCVLESIGRIFYYLGEYDDCETVFKYVCEQRGPITNDRVLYYLAACSEIRGSYEEALESYTASLRLADCEETRTGIGRVNAMIERAKSTAANGKGQLKMVAQP